MRTIRQVLACNRATSMLEFALLGPIVLFILVFGLEVLFSIYTKSVVNDALIEASRWGAANHTAQTGDRWNDVKYAINSKIALNYTLAVKAYSAWSAVDTNFTNVCSSGGTGDAALGSAGNIVVYCMYFDNPIVSSNLAGFIPLMSASSLRIVSTTVVQNEPF